MLLPVTGHAGRQRCAGPATCCCYQSAAPRWKRLITELLQVVNLTTAKSALRIAPQQRTGHRFIVRIRSMTWVELRGLEPLASCMPSTGSPSTRVHSRRSPSRAVHQGPLASARVAVLSCCASSASGLAGQGQHGFRRVEMASRVAVIGAGPCGLAQLHAFEEARRQGAEVPQVACFEKQSDWGGLWNYTLRTGLDAHC